MAVPDYQSLMLPLLTLAADRNEHNIREAIETLANQLKLTEQDREELLPSGKKRKFDDRVHWARTYLIKALLIENAGRAKFRLTERGWEVLKSNPNHINNKYLRRFPEFISFIDSKSNGEVTAEKITEEISQTPQEILDSSYQSLRKTLAQELLENIKNSSPKFFENLVVDLLIAMGYGGSRKDAGQAIGQVGDGGIDGIIKEDKLGFDVIYIQAKKWEGTVSRPDVQGFAGALMGRKANKGVFITTSNFSKQAIEFASGIDGRKIILIDGEQLAQLMIDHDIGVTEESKYIIKKIDLDYFSEE
ncbi:restriction endonuclease [Ktedonobacter sp. SOSP1-52]|uniref:restriction endonuclease n=1 Tax=Ktedonobacter sp. SOSP1-52 TaxID=2778366 RepID=UPI00191691E2|nr:restriction endonuclease [Ktedonobacter sp. SOSP1-52]GHO65726.1 restriction endonuclease [Ktedonobacter sp. SOSP1-52]